MENAIKYNCHEAAGASMLAAAATLYALTSSMWNGVIKYWKSYCLILSLTQNRLKSNILWKQINFNLPS